MAPIERRSWPAAFRSIGAAPVLILLVACLSGVTQSAWGSDPKSVEAELEDLRKRVEELESRESSGDEDPEERSEEKEKKWFEVGFGGQYRVNAYTVDNDDGDSQQTAARVRIRQDMDFRFGDRVATHLQVEVGHVDSNRTTSDEPFRVRHAVISFDLGRIADFDVGIVPLADYFGDTLFSSDWDYNPVAISMALPVGDGRLRVFAGNLFEGLENSAKDDLVHYQFDFLHPIGEGGEANVGVSVVTMEGLDGDIRLHSNFGFGGSMGLGRGFQLGGFLVGSYTERELIFGAGDDALGLAAKLELTSDRGFGLLVTYTTGASDRTGFLPAMALATTYGYWGYTGLLTVQGPTDTGFDGDAVNLSNNGFGLASAQARYTRPLWGPLSLYVAAGWYGASDAPDPREHFVGADFLTMITYSFRNFLTIDIGADYARLGDSLSGYPRGVQDAEPFNQDVGEERDKWAVFTRVQVEF